MDAGEGFEFREAVAPLHLQIVKRVHLCVPQNREWLDDDVTSRLEAGGGELAQRFEGVGRELAAMRALFDDRPARWCPKPFPHFGKLSRQQTPEERAHAHIGEEVAAPSDSGPARCVVAMFGVIQLSLIHISEPTRLLSISYAV